jgi:hypothetical protein
MTLDVAKKSKTFQKKFLKTKEFSRLDRVLKQPKKVIVDRDERFKQRQIEIE